MNEDEKEKKESEYLTLEQAAEEFPVEARTLYRHIKKGTVPGYKPFGRLVVKRKDIAAVFQRSKVKSA